MPAWTGAWRNNISLVIWKAAEFTTLQLYHGDNESFMTTNGLLQNEIFAACSSFVALEIDLNFVHAGWTGQVKILECAFEVAANQVADQAGIDYQIPDAVADALAKKLETMKFPSESNLHQMMQIGILKDREESTVQHQPQNAAASSNQAVSSDQPQHYTCAVKAQDKASATAKEQQTPGEQLPSENKHQKSSADAEFSHKHDGNVILQKELSKREPQPSSDAQPLSSAAKFRSLSASVADRAILEMGFAHRQEFEEILGKLNSREVRMADICQAFVSSRFHCLKKILAKVRLVS